MEYKYFASAPDQEYTKEFLKQIREEDLVAMKKKDEDFIESLWCKLRNTQDDRLRALRDGNKYKSTLLAGEVNGMLCVIKMVEDYLSN